jgi:hypothetical protein
MFFTIQVFVAMLIVATMAGRLLGELAWKTSFKVALFACVCGLIVANIVPLVI